jgi:hypothetical protein
MIAASALMAAGVAFANTPTSVLYVVHAKQGQLQKTKQQDKLVLSGVHVSYFSDRPVRKAGKVNVAKFVTDWSKGANNFSADNPNAALVADLDVLKKNNELESFIVLSKPNYNAQTKTVTLNVHALNPTKQLQAGKFTDVVLFVDNRHCNVAHPVGCF